MIRVLQLGSEGDFAVSEKQLKAVFGGREKGGGLRWIDLMPQCSGRRQQEELHLH